MTLKKEDLKEINDLAWDIIIHGLAKERFNPLSKRGKWSIESRTKIKSLVEGLRQFEEPENSVLHFIKFAEYTLPRSNLNNTQIELLSAVHKLQATTNESKDLREKVQFMLGYINWSIETYINVLNNSSGDFESKMKKVLDTEAKIIGETTGSDKVLKGLTEWKRRTESNERG